MIYLSLCIIYGVSYIIIIVHNFIIFEHNEMNSIILYHEIKTFSN